ncbi:MAG: hypothetical protein JNM07_02550 [Phycisphaerae bacterium]|nr:hypothetical protein [Phycisphaerae bacterium]
MADKPTLNRLFNHVHKELCTKLELARETLDHPTSKGTKSEDLWIELFRNYLPKRYDVHRAFVIDSKDVLSDQMDIVVHDRQFSPFVLNLNGEYFVPAESVYAVLEVRQTMNASNVEYAGQKIASVRKLHRTSLPIRHAGGEYPAKPPPHILGGLVTLDNEWNPPFGDSFHEAIAKVGGEGRLDIGCAAKHGGFEVKYTPNEPPAIAAERSKAALALFLLRFIARLQGMATVPCIDVLAYAANLQSEQ